jgi:hypothetical protein
VKILEVAPNLLNSIGLFRRLPLVDNEADGLGFTGLGLFIVYVPSSNGGILEVGCNKTGAKVIVRAADAVGTALQDRAGKEIPAGRQFVYHIPPGDFGWYIAAAGSTGTSYVMWATFTEVGLAREADNDDSDPLVPWNFWYFPNADSKKPFTAWGSPTLKPCQKYEAAFGKSGVFDWEKLHHNDPTATAEAWEGHCHNSAPASMIFKTPPAAGINHNGQHFLCEELKFFATEFYGREGGFDYVWGLPGHGSMGRQGFYQENKPADNPDRFGKLIGEFHNQLVRQLLQGREPVMMDLRNEDGADHSEVWNQAVFKYEAHMSETEPHGDWMDITVRTVLRSNADIMPSGFVSSGSPASIVADGPKADGKPKDTDSSAAAHKRDQELKYRLIYKDNGALHERNKKNRWFTVTMDGKSTELHAPRFMFKATRPTGNSSPDGNPLIDKADVLTLLELRDRYK